MLYTLATSSPRKLARPMKFSAGALLLIFQALSCLAQMPSAPQVFTLDQAIAYAQANYPAVRAALSQAAAARAVIGVARTAYLPQANSLYQMNRATANNIAGPLLPQGVIPAISGPVQASTSNESFWGSAAGVLASWEPIDFGYRGAVVNVARAGETTANAQAEVIRLDVALGVTNAYLGLLAARQVTQAAQTNVERRQVLANSVGVLVQNQLRPGADASRAEADLARARIGLIQAQTAENASRVVLANLLGLNAAGVDIVPGPLLALPATASLPEQEAAGNPYAVAQMSRIAEAMAREQVLAKSYFPKFFLQSVISGRGSGAGTGISSGGSAGLDLQRMNWAAGVQVTFPILQIFSIHAARRVEQANETTERARYDQSLLQISGQMALAQNRLEGARQVVQNTPAGGVGSL